MAAIHISTGIYKTIDMLTLQFPRMTEQHKLAHHLEISSYIELSFNDVLNVFHIKEVCIFLFLQDGFYDLLIIRNRHTFECFFYGIFYFIGMKGFKRTITFDHV